MAGCGTVGGGVARLIAERREAIARRTGLDLRLACVLVRDLAKTRVMQLPGDALTTEAADLLAPDIDVVVELIGGCDTARYIALAAIRAGKPLVTANKALIALHGEEVFAEARAAAVPVGIEASCCAGIPIVAAIERGLIANRIDALYGIVNGTCNYILTEMLDQRRGYADALADAQELGYAEADPTMDVGGIDSAHKLAILASLAFKEQADFGCVHVEGIEHLDLADLEAGRDLGYVCKLLAIARRYDDGVTLHVGPAFLEATHPLAHVRGPFNAVSIYGHAVGHTLYYGRGAGAEPTASAVVADIIDVVSGNARSGAFPATATESPTALKYKSIDETRSRFYLRLMVEDKPGVVADISRIFADQRISLSAINQHDPHDETGGQIVTVVVVTHIAREGDLRKALKRIGELPSVTQPPVAIRIVDEHQEG